MFISRRSMLIGAGACATVAGMALAWRHHPKSPQEPPSDIWDFQAPAPNGTTLQFKKLQGKPLLMNFWATWCAPCVEELPLLDAFSASQTGKWHVVAIAADQTAAVLRFLQRHPLQLPIAIAGPEGVALSGRLGNQQGGLPFSVAFDRHGKVAQRKIGQLTSSDLKQWVEQIH